MTKKFIIKEAWLLDGNGNEIMELNTVDINTIGNLVEEEDVRGGNRDIEDNE